MYYLRLVYHSYLEIPEEQTKQYLIDKIYLPFQAHTTERILKK